MGTEHQQHGPDRIMALCRWCNPRPDPAGLKKPQMLLPLVALFGNDSLTGMLKGPATRWQTVKHHENGV